jgi:hypothetical protein
MSGARKPHRSDAHAHYGGLGRETLRGFGHLAYGGADFQDCLEPLSKRSARPDASPDAAPDRHVPAWPCYQHGLHRPASPSLVHERPDRTAYFESGSSEACLTVER